MHLCNFSLRSLLISDKPDHFRLFKWSLETRQWSEFLQSCKGTHCHCACFILLFSLSPSSLQSCHFTLRMADLILPLSLNPPPPLRLSLSHSRSLNQSADLRTLGSYAVNLKCSLQWNDENTCSTINRRMIFFSLFFFSNFCCCASNVEINQIPCFNFFFFYKKETNWNEELELCFKHGLIISTETMFWRKERVLLESRACLRRFLINSEKSDGVQLKGCLAALLLFLFFPSSPKCWQTSSSSTPGLSGTTFPVEFCELSTSSAQPRERPGSDRHTGVVIHEKWHRWTVSPQSGPV